MPIDFLCPLCGEQLSVNTSLAGKKGLCPICREQVDVPTRSDLPARKKFSSIPANRPAGKKPAFDAPDFPDSGRSADFEYYCRQIPPDISVKDGSSHSGVASSYLQSLINAAAGNGWEFYRVDTIGIQEVPGCLMALLGQRTITVSYYVVTFRRPRD